MKKQSSYNEEAFEFVDYTTVSDLERSSDAIEKILREWNVQDDLSDVSRHESLTFGEDRRVLHLLLTLHCHRGWVKSDLMSGSLSLSCESDGHSHPLHRWTGLSKFLVLAPAKDKPKINPLSLKSTLDLGQAKTLISACAIALQNVTCTVPVFIQVGHERNKLFLGYGLQRQGEKCTEVRFNTSVTPAPLDDDGFTTAKNLFLAKIKMKREDYGLSSEMDEDHGLVAAMHTYALKSWPNGPWKQAEHNLPFGSYNDPLRTLNLYALFTFTPRGTCTDEDLVLLKARSWHLTCEFAQPSQQRGFLSSLLDQAFSSWIKDPDNDRYLAPYDANNKSNEILDWKQDHGFVQTLFYTMAQSRSRQKPISEKDNDNPLEIALSYIFRTESKDDDTKKSLNLNLRSTQDIGSRIKQGTTVPVNSFLWDVILCHLRSFSKSCGGSSFLRLLWGQILCGIRLHWEQLVPIPRIKSSCWQDELQPEEDSTLGIDLQFDILHQKLSMINCCILRLRQNIPAHKRSDSLKRDAAALNRTEESKETSNFDKFNNFLEKFVDPVSDADIPGDEGEESDDADFFDSVEMLDDAPQEVHKKTGDESSEASSMSDLSELTRPHRMSESFVQLKHLSSAESVTAKEEDNEIQDSDKFEGRKHQHTLTLLKTGQPMWIPETQDIGFMTEDMIEHKTGLLEDIGTSDDAAHIRAQIQSEQLFSDMQAFKAANPHAQLEDFVRWYSPRDWIEDQHGPEGTTGHLSARMSKSGNLWKTLWKKSRRIPSVRQAPLFNFAAEGEKALRFLEAVSIHDLFSSLLPTMGLVAYDNLVNLEVLDHSEYLAKGTRDLGQSIENFQWNDLQNGKCTLEPLLYALRQHEAQTSNAISLLHKLPLQYDLVDRLLGNTSSHVKEGDELLKVMQLFGSEEPGPSQREYIFQGTFSLNHGQEIQQRQYVLVKDNETRVMDTTLTP